MAELKKTMILVKAMVLVALTTVALYAFSFGPPPGFTGGFGEPTCQFCHSCVECGPRNGSFSISGVPKQFSPGQSFPITVQISQKGPSRWGFQLAARFQADASQAGTFEITDPVNTQSLDKEIQYIEQTSDGTHAGIEDGPVCWSFNWIAPDTVMGPVEFDASGIAADNDGSPLGDFVYTDSVISNPTEF